MGQWAEIPGHDQEFRTYVLVPEPAAAISIAIGLALISGFFARLRNGRARTLAN
jgi:hypothetical protein